ncbi:MAG: pyruvate, phosphate dikinase [Erysipelothrix sp.]|nr:pyruvate, phosphate dikinase [Erysipelothrix sp.]
MEKKLVYMFSEGDATMRNVLGGKGSNLAEMTKLGLPVPQGFVVSTDACNDYYADSETMSANLMDQVKANMLQLEGITKKSFENEENALLVSVRSGARASMPGMMDTILNLGLNDKVAAVMAIDNARLAYDSYRRLIQMYGDVVKNVDRDHFEKDIDTLKVKFNKDTEHDFTPDELLELVNLHKDTYLRLVKEPFPQDPFVQLTSAIESVFKSWNNTRAKYYRRMNNIPDEWGTAVTVQEMVFGNRNDNCATGVAFSRNPATGEDELYGEFLYNAQGEDVVAGTHTPLPISELAKSMPAQYKQFLDVSKQLEKHYHDMQDMEFTIDDHKLYILQTRAGKRTAQAAVKIANDLVKEGVIDKQEALDSLDVRIIDGLLHPQFDTDVVAKLEPIATGLPASPGAATGLIAFTAQKAVEYFDQGKPVILVRLETSPEDIEGMHISEGILTARGGMTSHAAVVARGMGKSCIVGSSDLIIRDNVMIVNNVEYHEGDQISIDGGTGFVYAGRIETQSATISEDFNNLLEWADEKAELKVYTNADSSEEIQVALEFGAQGVGLVRTEHMFFEADRIRAVREMILSTTPLQREIALRKILPTQREDFEKIFRTMKDKSVTVRYLDPPLHEFMPTTTQDIEELAEIMNMSSAEIRDVIRSLHEFNPMMGHRGCRLAISYPEIALMQTRALIEAAINVSNELDGITIKPEIMIPLVGDVKEFTYLASRIRKLADELIAEANISLEYMVGTMIELPRACLLATDIAKEVDFISFGTNDLTQMTYGFSRDDAAIFLKNYYDIGIYENDPFQTLDTVGVGSLIKMAVEKARAVKPNIKIGVCGEHGGDPQSINFFKQLHMDYVSCSPYRVPIARIALATTTK